MTHCTSYKFALLKRYIINPSWEIVHNSFLENPIWIRLVALERGRRGLLQVAISELDDPKLQRYIRFNMLHYWTLLFETYQLAKKSVDFCILVMCCQFFRKNFSHPNVMKPTHKKIEKRDQCLRIQPLRGGNLLYIT